MGDDDFGKPIIAIANSFTQFVQGRPFGVQYHIQDVHRAGGIFGILGELDRAGLINRNSPTVHSKTIGDAIDQWMFAIVTMQTSMSCARQRPVVLQRRRLSASRDNIRNWTSTAQRAVSAKRIRPIAKMADWLFFVGTSQKKAAS